MTKLTAKKKKKVDGHEVAGKIITFFFAAILIVGIWFLVDLFRDRTVNYKNVAGSWKLTGNPDVYYTFEPYDENKKCGMASTRNAGEESSQRYTYTIQDKENGNYKLLLMQPVDVGGYKAGEVVTITITGVSKAQLSCIVNDSKMTSMTRQDIF